MTFEHYIVSGQRRLRCGFTTGVCAALATQGAMRLLFDGTVPERLSLMTPQGIVVDVEPHRWGSGGDGSAFCSVLKDAGDDSDVTDELEIVASVRLRAEAGVVIDGGEGVGRVTRPGLDQPVGAAAINSTPRAMIEEQVHSALEAHEDVVGVAVTISVPEGRAVAERTFNGQLGIEGGISILGTSGIVEPMSSQALIDTIALELSQAVAEGKRRLLLTPGNYGRDFVSDQGWRFDAVANVTCSNFLGDTLDHAVEREFTEILLVAHAGKLVKVAAGIMNTHSRVADGRREILCAHAACAGASRDVCRALMDATTTDAWFALLDREGLRTPVIRSLMEAIDRQLRRRVGSDVTIGAVMFSLEFGELGRTGAADELLSKWQEASR